MAKILSIVPYKIFPAKVGGQKGIALFNEYLAKETELICITVKSNQPSYAKGYKVLNILSGSSYRYANPMYFFTIKKYIQQFNITHLLLEHPYYGWLGILLKKATGIKLIVHSHNIEATRWKSLDKWWWKILWRYEQAIHRAADYNFFIHDEDRYFAVKNFRLDESKCFTITYGIEIDKATAQEEKDRCKALLRATHQISTKEKIFLFNGALDYRPNLAGLNIILDKINPLMIEADFAYKIIICGRGLPAAMNSLQQYAKKNIIYAGFVDDISIYFKGADVFINPVVDGGGIKTKLVEALGYGSKAVSTRNGSIGINEQITGGQLSIVPDHQWELFAEQMIMSAKQLQEQTPDKFYEEFYWGNIARKAVSVIRGK